SLPTRKRDKANFPESPAATSFSPTHLADVTTQSSGAKYDLLKAARCAAQAQDIAEVAKYYVGAAFATYDLGLTCAAMRWNDLALVRGAAFRRAGIPETWSSIRSRCT